MIREEKAKSRQQGAESREQDQGAVGMSDLRLASWANSFKRK